MTMADDKPVDRNTHIPLYEHRVEWDIFTETSSNLMKKKEKQEQQRWMSCRVRGEH